MIVIVGIGWGCPVEPRDEVQECRFDEQYAASNKLAAGVADIGLLPGVAQVASVRFDAARDECAWSDRAE